MKYINKYKGHLAILLLMTITIFYAKHYIMIQPTPIVNSPEGELWVVFVSYLLGCILILAIVSKVTKSLCRIINGEK